MNTLPFYVFLFVHISSLILGFGSVMVIDSFGLLWLRKKITTTGLAKIANHTQKLIWLGWGGLVLSGIGLITIKGYVDNLTMIKLFFVGMLGLNGIFLHFIKKAIDRTGDNPMSRNLMFRVGLSSAVSQLGWWGAFTIGFVHRHWQHTINWPKHPEIYMSLIGATILLVALFGDILSRGNFKANIEYLKDNPQNLWFKRRLYGWGWVPVRWQGWLVIAVYILGALIFSQTIDETSSRREVAFTFILPLALMTITLLRICYKKGEKPRWQWGLPQE